MWYVPGMKCSGVSAMVATTLVVGELEKRRLDVGLLHLGRDGVLLGRECGVRGVVCEGL